MCQIVCTIIQTAGGKPVFVTSDEVVGPTHITCTGTGREEYHQIRLSLRKRLVEECLDLGLYLEAQGSTLGVGALFSFLSISLFSMMIRVRGY